MKMRNKFPSRCTACGEGIPANSWIEYDRGQRMAYHEQCAPDVVVSDGKIDARFNVTHHTNGAVATKTIDTVQSTLVPDNIDTTLQSISTMLDALSRSITHLSAQTTDVRLDNQQLHVRLGDLARKITELENRPQKVVEITVKQHDITTNIKGTFHYKLPQLLRLATSLHASDRNIWITGPAGSGKTTAAEQLASVLSLAYEAHGAIDSPYKLSGYRDANGIFRDTSFYRIYKNGGVILLDECDGSSPQALLEINGALANNSAAFPEGMTPRHSDCYILCAANTWGFGGDANYVGRSRMDAAFLDRFVKMDWPYDEQLEQSIALDDEWTRVVQQTRKATYSAGAKVVISPRSSIKGGQLLAGGCSRVEVAEAIFGCYYSHSAWPTIGRAVERWCQNG